MKRRFYVLCKKRNGPYKINFTSRMTYDFVLFLYFGVVFPGRTALGYKYYSLVFA